MVETFRQVLPHGITLSCRAAGPSDGPVIVFLHGFPEAAFVWDPLLEFFAQPAHGGYRCIAPNLRGFEHSSAPLDAGAYRPRHLVQDIVALISLHTSRDAAPRAGGALACLVAHDWGGALAWNLANQHPHLLRRLAIVNSPHPGTFLRELKTNARQQAASSYMNFLVRPGAETLLARDDFGLLWKFLAGNHSGSTACDTGTPAWLDEATRHRYREVWHLGLHGGCNLYRASPLRPAQDGDTAVAKVELPRTMLTVDVPTLLIWGMRDTALLPQLMDGLDAYVPDLCIHPVAGASHWIVHEQPGLVIRLLADFLRGASSASSSGGINTPSPHPTDAP